MVIICCTIFFLLCHPPAISADQILPFKEGDVLTLTQCVEIALKNQPTLRAARSSVEASQARVTQSKADYLPQISLPVSIKISTFADNELYVVIGKF